jgi:hypothetical protein
MTRPKTRVIRIAAQIGKPFVRNNAIITLVTPTTAPTDKSMPAVIITKVFPIDRIAIIAP